MDLCAPAPFAVALVLCKVKLAASRRQNSEGGKVGGSREERKGNEKNSQEWSGIVVGIGIGMECAMPAPARGGKIGANQQPTAALALAPPAVSQWPISRRTAAACGSGLALALTDFCCRGSWLGAENAQQPSFMEICMELVMWHHHEKNQSIDTWFETGY
jgi:hypothetical protein